MDTPANKKCRTLEGERTVEDVIMSNDEGQDSRKPESNSDPQQPKLESMPVPQCPVTSTAQLRIEMAHYPSLRTLRCEYRDGVLVLEGRVMSFYHKQLAQEMMRDISGVDQIKNLISVVPQLEYRSIAQNRSDEEAVSESKGSNFR